MIFHLDDHCRIGGEDPYRNLAAVAGVFDGIIEQIDYGLGYRPRIETHLSGGFRNGAFQAKACTLDVLSEILHCPRNHRRGIALLEIVDALATLDSCERQHPIYQSRE